MPNNGAYNNQASSPAERNVGPVGLTRLPVAGSMPAGVIFQEDFDDQPDWHSGLPENNTGAFPVNGAGPDREQRQGTHTVPNNWDSVYQDPLFAPSVGEPGFHETIEILAANASKARGSAGKCFVQRRDARSEGSSWTSDGQLLKLLGAGYDRLYVEFYISFDPNWTYAASNDQTKIFRVGSWSGVGSEFQAFGGGEQGPLYIFDWKRDSYGVRNLFTCRGGPHGDNYILSDSELGSFPQKSGSLNFTDHIQGQAVGGGTAQLEDKLNGGFIPTSGIIEHTQIYGANSEWTKMGFYVQMNSAPGAADGQFQQWFDDKRILNVRNLMWVPSVQSGQPMPKWNFFSIGGNDYFKSYDESEKRQEWWALDDLVVRETIPAGLTE
ncbi:hypothetical protein KZZ05_08540 [Marinobacter adhaerens]|uniref:hypothetical protein n=1 Tax=Marinobacter adhaerens TaxID=1033846 RepID=UPI001C5F64BB|nr:hypothetical protein [Marinobacter adhaerens]MBW4978321.1 hypothetical protein [Marinobacter adhaerens]